MSKRKQMQRVQSAVQKGIVIEEQLSVDPILSQSVTHTPGIHSVKICPLDWEDVHGLSH